MSSARTTPKAAAKITLSEPIAIPFDKLVLSQANVRRVADGQSIEDLAEDIAHRGLMQNLNVRPILDEAAADNAGEILSPMPGTVVAVGIEDGAEVTAGTAVVVVEAMKMEHALTAPIDGTVALTVKVGDKVSAGQALAHVQADPAQAAQEN